ncbi:hypothetical protein KAK06_13145 [Ideonella sp. 4Y11]|uniref:Uncharacterized protein n=1 Tax=Ideonella aquatica TaxID=2824119 RepID=A0A941BJW0_9BURK|nr:hypothetical protein [Ideonella aquatica]MBQ0959892.1 hypothetical protein [Ideonella aquatica]
MTSLIRLDPGILETLQRWRAQPDQVLPAALAALDDQLPWAAVLQPVGHLAPGAAPLALPLLQTDHTTDWTGAAGAQARASLAADARLGVARLADLPDGRATIALSLLLALQTQADADTRAAWVSLGADAALTQRLSVHWQQAVDPTQSLLEALRDTAASLAWPHDLSALLALARQGHWQGLQLQWEGQARLGLQLRSQWDAVGWSVALDGQDARVGLSLGLAADWRAQRDSLWQLTLAPGHGDDGTPLLALALHDRGTRTQEAALTLAASANVAELAAQAERALQRASGAVDSALLDTLTRPGQAAADALATLADEAFDGPLAERAAWVAHWREQLSQALDEALPDLLMPESADPAWWPRLLQGLPLPAAQRAAWGDRLAPLARRAEAAARSRLQQSLQALLPALQGAGRQAVLDRLGALGAQFDALPDALDSASALQAARHALQRYAAQRQQLQQALQQAQRQRLALTVAGQWQQQRSDEAMVALHYALQAPPSAATQQLHQALCSGQLQRVGPLLEQAGADGGVRSASGWLQATAQTLAEQRLSLDLPDSPIGSHTHWSRHLQIRSALGSGELIGAQAEAAVETAISHRWKQRSARLGVQLALLPPAQGGVPRLAASLDGGFIAAHEGRASRERVQALLDDLALAHGAPRRSLGDWLGLDPAALDSADWRGLSLAWPLHLTPAQWQHFAEQPAEAVDRTALAALLPVFARRYTADALFSDDPVADLRDLAGGADDHALLAWLRRFPERYVDRYSVAAVARNVNIAAAHSGGVADRGTRQYLIAQRLAATVLAPSRLQALARQAQQALDSLPAPLAPAAARAALDPLLQRMQQALAPVALASETWLAIGLGGAPDEPVAWPLVGFATAMARLAALPVPPGFVPVLQWGEQARALTGPD